MSNISKNARANRGGGIKVYMKRGDKEVEVSPFLFIGSFVGKGKYMAVQEKATKEMFLDKDGFPVSWNLAEKIYK